MKIEYLSDKELCELLKEVENKVQEPDRLLINEAIKRLSIEKTYFNDEQFDI